MKTLSEGDPRLPATAGQLRGAPWSLRFDVWRRRKRLDRELAAGASVAGRPDLRVRADQLTDPDRLRALAAVLANLLNAADEPPGSLERQVPARALNRPAVLLARGELVALAARLSSGQPISPRAAALAHLLAFDETGPLYGTTAPQAAHTHIDSVRCACRLPGDRPGRIRQRRRPTDGASPA